jgi:hypothetical protein
MTATVVCGSEASVRIADVASGSGIAWAGSSTSGASVPS